METKQATQATTSKNLKYETSQQKAALLNKNTQHTALSDIRKIEFRQSPAKLDHNLDLSTLLTILVEKFDVLICAKLV